MTLARQSARGSSTEGATPVLAARCTMTSAPSAARSASSSSRMSPTRRSTGKPEVMGPMLVGEASVKSQTAFKSSRVPTFRLSTTRTPCSPSSTSDLIKATPIKPQPPVTSQFMVASLATRSVCIPRETSRLHGRDRAPGPYDRRRRPSTPRPAPPLLAEIPAQAYPHPASRKSSGWQNTLHMLEGGFMTTQSEQPDSEERRVDHGEGLLFEQFRVERGCLGYVIADEGTRRAAILDPEVEMVEPMLDFVFEHGLKPSYIIDTHTHRSEEHTSELQSRQYLVCRLLIE